MSDKIYHSLSKDDVEPFLDWDATVARLDSLKNIDFSDQVAELQLAIDQSWP